MNNLMGSCDEYECVISMTDEDVKLAIKETNNIVTSRKFIESLPQF